MNRNVADLKARAKRQSSYSYWARQALALIEENETLHEKLSRLEEKLSRWGAAGADPIEAERQYRAQLKRFNMVIVPGDPRDRPKPEGYEEAV